MRPVKENDVLTALLLRAAAKDRAAFAELYERMSAKLFGVIVRILGKDDVAEEVLQECFVTIWQKAGTFDRALASPVTWMAVIARNRAIDQKRRKVEKLSSEAVALDENLPSLLLDPEQETQRGQQLERLQTCLETLSPAHRDMVLLAYLEGWSRKELSTRFDSPVATIKTNLRRALTALKGCLDG